ncbi:peptidylprolyl isomerase PrsA [Priestia megaterium]|nr:peptidylprolyl isomerase PrsA [Priestia megaterium]
MKKSLIALSTAASIVALTACNNDASDANDSSKVIVETDAGNVTQGELYQEMKTLIGQDQFNTLVRNVVDEKVLSEKYKITDKELDKELENLRAQYGDQIDTAIQQNGEDTVKDMLKVDLLRDKVATADIKVSEKELKEAYEAKKPEIRASHILVEDEKTAKEVKAKLDKGEDFAKLAEEYSTDKASAQKGGDLGFFGAGEMVPAFQEAAYKLKKGEVSAPVKSDYGYHIIKLVDKKELASYKEMKDELETEIKRSKVDQATLEKKLKEELDKANVKVKDKKIEPAFEVKAEDAASNSDEK